MKRERRRKKKKKRGSRRVTFSRKAWLSFHGRTHTRVTERERERKHARKKKKKKKKKKKTKKKVRVRACKKKERESQFTILCLQFASSSLKTQTPTQLVHDCEGTKASQERRESTPAAISPIVTSPPPKCIESGDLSKPPDPLPVTSTAHPLSSTAHFQSYPCFPICFTAMLPCELAPEPLVAPSHSRPLGVSWFATTSQIAIILDLLCRPPYRVLLQLFRAGLAPQFETPSPFSHGVYDFVVDMQPSPTPLCITIWWTFAVATPLDNFDDCPNEVTLQSSDLAPYGHRYYDLGALLYLHITLDQPLLLLILLFHPIMPICSILLNFPMMLPTDLDGSSHNNPSGKDKVAIPTFSWVVKLTMGSLSGDPIPRTQPEHHVYPTESKMESKNKSRLPNYHRKCGILPTPFRFTALKVTTVTLQDATHTVVVSDTSCAEGEVGTTSGPNLEPTPLPSKSLQAGKNQFPPVVSDPEADLPIDDEDDMDIFLNLEGDDDPQHSSEFSKKRSLLLLPSVIAVDFPWATLTSQFWYCIMVHGGCLWHTMMTLVGLSLYMSSLWLVLYGLLLVDACDWSMLLVIHGLSIGLVLWRSCFCAHWWEVYSRANAGALLDLRRQPCRRDHRSVMIVLNLRPCCCLYYYYYGHYFVWCTGEWYFQ
ncbi:hypothetical protein Cgig2_020906 [Carnegiea gigantea]|uniref:Uncharacterized protein n=1 Tax=Carnegiea gigantea TaxID=171969 RepID=A0A9Q1GVU4_9CARY|nr:hypothetical protein Cgig2_020906 [Carnegiea gigantea]